MQVENLYKKDFSELEIKTANSLQVPPIVISAIDIAYESIARFTGVTSLEELDNMVVEKRRGKINDYSEIPITLKLKVKEYIKIDPNFIEKHFNQAVKEKRFKGFCKRFLEEKLQPKDFHIDGILTQRHLMFAAGEDKTYSVETIGYQEN